MRSSDSAGSGTSDQQTANGHTLRRGAFALLVVAACGVVYGDIGTSVLYTFREIFFGPHTSGHVPITHENVLGAVSLVFWALLLLVCVKYTFFVLYADHHGEGGTFAILGLLQGAKFLGAGILIGVMLILSAGLLFGEGLITPAISILSAVEGLEYMTDRFKPYIVWISAAILVALFSVQRIGTARVGLWFGYCTLIWFFCIGLIGAVQVWGHPQVLWALNPWYGFAFLQTIGFSNTLIVLGFVTLAVTGVEAMYADMGHFGRRPIQFGWLLVAFPCLLLQYFGQGAFLVGELHDGESLPAMMHLFYATFSDVFPGTAPLIFMVGLATVATIIASQALISGAFSLAAQAIALGYGGRMEITHTSIEHEGQIYIRTLNWLLCAGCLVLIFTFQSSSSLAAAYGLAVSAVMLNTSISMIAVATVKWSWSVWRAVLLFGFFACIEGTFLFANSLKFFQGGFVPLLIGGGLFVAMSNYHWGRIDLIASAYAEYANLRTMSWFLELKQRLIAHGGVLRDGLRTLMEAERTDVFMISRPVTQKTDGVPVILRAYLKRHGTVARNLLLLSLQSHNLPTVQGEKQYEIIPLGANVWVIIAHYGFMQKPYVPGILLELSVHPAFRQLDLSLANIEIGEEELLVNPETPWFRKLWVWLFTLQLKVSVPAHRYFGLVWDHPTEMEGIIGIEHLSKTIIPVRVGKSGSEVFLPDRDSRKALA
jgi:KUP system potassium uptake protein